MRVLHLLLVALALIAGVARAATPGPVVRRVSDDEEVGARPGQVVTAVFSVGAAGADRVLVEALALPPGWTAATPTGPLAIAAGATRTRILAFQVPLDAGAGEWPVTYTVTDPAAPDRPATAGLRVRVARVAGLRIEVRARPEYVVAGDTGAFTLRVTNLGNVAERVALDAAAERGLAARLSMARLDLAPGAFADVALDLDTDREEPRPTERVVRLVAQAGGTRADSAIIVPIVPRAGRKDGLRHLPLRAAVVGTTDGARVGVQAVVEGRGALDAAGAWVADVALRGPDAAETGAFGERDEYRLDLVGPWARVSLGDRVYSLSPLTNPGRYGRGLGGELRAGPLFAGAYHVWERDVARPDGELGVTAGARFGEEGRVGVQLLRRASADPDVDDTVLSSLAALLPFFGSSRIESEVALDVSAARPSVASRAQLLLQLPSGLALTVRELAATPDFGGYQQDLHRTDASLVVPLAKQVALRTSGAREERNLARDPDRGAAPIGYRAESHVVWSPRAWSVEGGLAGALAEDALLGASWQEAAARVQLARGVPELYLSLLGIAGVHRDAASALLHVGTQVGGNVTWSPGTRLALRGRASWGTDDGAPSSLFAVDAQLALAASWRPIDALVGEIEGRRRFSTAGWHDDLDTRAQYTFAGGAAVEARYRLGHTAEAATDALDHSARLTVSVPVGVPIGRNTSVGRLRGRLFDVDSRAGLGGVLLRIAGQVATTASDGTFLVTGLPTGAQRLDVDMSSLGFTRVALDELPLPVTIRGGEVVDVEIPTAASASVAGKVFLQGFSPTDSDETLLLRGDGNDAKTRPAAGVSVVLVRGDERHTRVTDARGEFRVDGLRPGRWTMRVPASQVPTFYTVTEPERPLTLAPGVVAAVDVPIEPLVRLIQLVGRTPLEVRTREADTRRATPVPNATTVATARRTASRPRRATTGSAVSPNRKNFAGAAAPLGALAHATLSGEATVTSAGVFLGGRLTYQIWDDDGEVACQVDAEWRDDGGELPLEPCEECVWETSATLSRTRVTGAACAEIDVTGLLPREANWGWAPVLSYGGTRRKNVLLSWGGDGWVPFANGVDPEDLNFVVEASMPP